MTTAIAFDLLGIGLIGPGLPSWSEAQAVFERRAAYQPATTVVPAPQRLPAAERRRAGAAVKVALSVADAACADAGHDPAALATVFTSSTGDGANCHALCETLAHPPGPDRLVSPTRFTNSVHNAAAGYWHIAVGSRQPSSSVCAHDDSFGAGLIAALAQLPGLATPLLLVASDSPYPEPLHATRPLPDAMGVGLVIAAPGTPGAMARLAASLQRLPSRAELTPCRDAALEKLRRRIPAARVLPLLEAIARRQPAHVVLPGGQNLALQVALEFPA